MGGPGLSPAKLLRNGMAGSAMSATNQGPAAQPREAENLPIIVISGRGGISDGRPRPVVANEVPDNQCHIIQTVGEVTDIESHLAHIVLFNRQYRSCDGCTTL